MKAALFALFLASGCHAQFVDERAAGTSTGDGLDGAASAARWASTTRCAAAQFPTRSRCAARSAGSIDGQGHLPSV
jgi:hypothetical protein